MSCLVVEGGDWHPGVVGLIASRLKERFNIPSFAIAFNGKIGTGSGRSLSGVDLGSAVRRAVDRGFAIKGGGHAMAAGVTVARDRIDDLRAFMNDALEASVEAARSDDALMVDARARRTRRLSRAGAAGGAGWPIRAGKSRAAVSLFPNSRWPMPRSSEATMCARGCALATAPWSTPSPSERRIRRSATRCCAGRVAGSMSPRDFPAMSFAASNASRPASSTPHRRTDPATVAHAPQSLRIL